jgi:hypothetical protein
MNKLVFYVAATLLCVLIARRSFATDDPAANPASGRTYIKTLIINADVTVILVNSDKISIDANGNEKFMSQVQIERSGDTLVINSQKRKDLREKGVIYVSASHLRRIRINSSAELRTFNVLQLPVLDVVINGDCKIAVSNTGVTNLIETKHYSVEQTKQVKEWPASVFLAANDLP